MDSSRTHIMRKLHSKLGIFPSPTPLGSTSALPQPGFISSLPITAGPFFNPHSLALPAHQHRRGEAQAEGGWGWREEIAYACGGWGIEAARDGGCVGEDGRRVALV